MIDIDELKRLHETATPGLLEVKSYGSSIAIFADGKRIAYFYTAFEDIPSNEAQGSAALLVYLRNHVPEILEALECCNDEAAEIRDLTHKCEAMYEENRQLKEKIQELTK